MTMLTARFVETVKPQPPKRLEFGDHVVRGLSLRLTPAGVKSWALRYRTQAGEQRRLTLGGFPALNLESARKAALKALGTVAALGDPAAEKLSNRRAARRARTEKPQTLAALWITYERDHLSCKRPSTAAFQTWLWVKRLAPILGHYRLAELDRATVRAATREIGAASHVVANRALALLRHMLNVAVAEEFLPASPLAQFGALFPETSRDRVLCDDELHSLWCAMNANAEAASIAVSARMCTALRLVLLTAARPGDVAGLQADEIDIAARSWTIPAARFKAARAHTVPLSDAAWRLLEQAYDEPTERWRGPAFPSARDPSAPMRRASLTRAMQRIAQSAGLARVTPHDLRRTAATYMASERVGAAPHIVGAVLGHAPEGALVTSIYNRHRYTAEKREALSAWARLLESIVGGPTQQPVNIVHLARR